MKDDFPVFFPLGKLPIERGLRKGSRGKNGCPFRNLSFQVPTSETCQHLPPGPRLETPMDFAALAR